MAWWAFSTRIMPCFWMPSCESRAPRLTDWNAIRLPGEPTIFHDTFQNQELREMSGVDFSVTYLLDTSFGAFDFKWNGAYLEKFEQTPGSELTDDHRCRPGRRRLG